MLSCTFAYNVTTGRMLTLDRTGLRWQDMLAYRIRLTTTGDVII